MARQIMTIKEWQSLKVVKKADIYNSQIRQDKDGNLLEWLHGGKRIEYRILRTKQ